MAGRSSPAGQGRPIPFYRDVKVLAVLAQIAFVIVIGLLFWYLYSNAAAGLRRSRIPGGFDFLWLTAGFPISEGIAYQPTDSYARAFVVGVVNTIRVSIIGIILATILGTLIGIGRLSTNWLVRAVTTAYVEIIRNTPLLVQLIFWYVAVILKLPRVRDSLGIEGLILVSNRGLKIAWPEASQTFAVWRPWLFVALGLGIAVYALRRRQIARADRPGPALSLALGVAILTSVVGALVVYATAGASPLVLDQPELQGFNYVGGAALTPEFFALLLGLTIYTAAFIAEIVRGGIQAINRGQREAARALALTPFQTLRLVIFPQALRVIIPPLTNQYLNLTKNSSLGIAVGFFDLFNISNTIFNQSGRSVQVIAMVMASYLLVSLTTSALMNIYNHRIRLIER